MVKIKKNKMQLVEGYWMAVCRAERELSCDSRMRKAKNTSFPRRENPDMRNAVSYTVYRIHVLCTHP